MAANDNDPEQVVLYDTWELQRQECQRVMMLSDTQLAHIYRRQLAQAIRDLTDMIEGRCRPVEDIIRELEGEKSG